MPLSKFVLKDIKILLSISSFKIPCLHKCIAAREAASVMNTYYVPLDAAFVEEWHKHPGHTGVLLTKEGCHPTIEGYKLIADTFMQAWNLEA